MVCSAFVKCICIMHCKDIRHHLVMKNQVQNYCKIVCFVCSYISYRVAYNSNISDIAWTHICNISYFPLVSVPLPCNRHVLAPVSVVAQTHFVPHWMCLMLWPSRKLTWPVVVNSNSLTPVICGSSFKKYDLQNCFRGWYLELVLWNFLPVNNIEHHIYVYIYMYIYIL